jgi:hypothetical protein
MVGSSQEERTTTSRVIIAIIVALGLMGVVAITIFVIQQAEARGCINPNAPAGGGIAANASQGRCVR